MRFPMENTINQQEYERLKRLRELTNNPELTEEEVAKVHYWIPPHDVQRKPARQVHNYRWQIHNDYYGYPWINNMW